MGGYRTVQGETVVELEEKRSRFIGRSYPVSDEKEIQERLAELRKTWYDASHHCWAYALTENGSIARYSDDGEPGGTAGLPILHAIQGRGLTQTLVVVTRYFGGIKLGTGGLVRAYGKTANLALSQAQVIHYLPAVRLCMRISYPFYGKIQVLLSEEQTSFSVENTQFAETITLWLVAVEDRLTWLKQTLSDMTGGSAELQKVERLMFPFDDSERKPSQPSLG